MPADPFKPEGRASVWASHEGDGHTCSPDQSPSEVFGRLRALLSEAREYLSYSLAARADGVKASIRRMGLYAGVGLVGLVALVSIVAMASVLLLLGFAGGLGALLGGRMWLGALIVGAVFLIAIALGAWLGVRYMTKNFRQKTVEKYEQRKAGQRSKFGRDVRQATAQRAE